MKKTEATEAIGLKTVLSGRSIPEGLNIKINNATDNRAQIDMPYYLKGGKCAPDTPFSQEKRGIKFSTVTGREAGETFSQTPNLVIGHHTLRGVDDQRFHSKY